MIWNSNPWRDKGSKTLTPGDFVPGESKRQKQQTPREQYNLLARQFGAGKMAVNG